jgi:hypothetical protein
MPTQLSDIAHVIQLAVAPVFLLTAIGTILSALNIRLGRIIDRRRVLENRLQAQPQDEGGPEAIVSELQMLAQRIRLTYHSIMFAVASGILVCLVVATGFLGVFVAIDLSDVVGVMFVLSMFSLIGSLVTLLREIFLAVAAGQHDVLAKATPRA